MKNPTRMSDCIIPNELLTKLLLLADLPIKCLVRLTLVCKSWQSLIRSSDFITDHLNQTKLSDQGNDNNHLLLIRYYPDHRDQYYFYTDDAAFDQYEVFDSPLKCPVRNQFFGVEGSCNGLMLCSFHDHARDATTVVLWNPSIRKSMTLPCPQLTNRTRRKYDHVFGFGFDSRTNDYKVVRMVDYYFDSPRVEIYKLSTGSWVTTNATIDPSCFVSTHHRQAFINGAVHWHAYESGVDGGASIIMSFDMSDEVFYEIMLLTATEEERSGFGTEMPLAVCGEWLSYIRYHDRNHNRFCSIWVMKEYGVAESWTKVYTFDLNGPLERTLGFRRNGEILVLMRNKKFVSYDPETRQINKHLNNNCNSRPFYVNGYVKSLVLL